MECAWSVALSGPDDASQVDLVTRVLDVKSAEIRERLQDAEVKLARLRQSVPPDSSSKSWFKCRRGARQIVDQSLHDLCGREAVSGFGASVSVNSASGVIARSLSNELKDAFNDGCISDKSVLDRVVC